GIHFSFTSLTLALRSALRRGGRTDRSPGAGVVPDDPRKDSLDVRDETSGTCRNRRIANAGRSRPSADAGQPRRRRGGPGQREADHHGRLAPPLAPPPLASSPLVSGPGIPDQT